MTLAPARRGEIPRGRIPTSRDEEWRLTSVASIAETPFPLAQDGASQVSVTRAREVPAA